MRRILQGKPSEHLPREADASARPNVPIMAIPTGAFDQQDFTLPLTIRNVCSKPLPWTRYPLVPDCCLPLPRHLSSPFPQTLAAVLNPLPPALLPQLVLFTFVTTTKKNSKWLTASLPCIKTQLVFYHPQPELHQSPGNPAAARKAKGGQTPSISSESESKAELYLKQGPLGEMGRDSFYFVRGDSDFNVM